MSSVVVSAVDAAGVHVEASDDVVVDVLFDGRRIDSFWTLRDTDPAGGGRRRTYAWPATLVPHLAGATTVAVVEHVDEAVVWEDEVRFSPDERRTEVVDGKGNPLALDKSGRLHRVFGSRSAEHVAPLLDSMREVVDVLERVGLEPFVAYGTLLGAVRSGDFIGHDSDADLGYVSRHRYPVDAVRESFAVQRELLRMGVPVVRYSGLAFKILVEESDGTRRGLDVFGGLHVGERLYLMGEVGAPFEAAWIRPRSEVQLAGRTFPAPARPEELLVAMYGEGWRVPDPAYRFSTPPSTVRRLSGWFRGTRHDREAVWDPFYHRSGPGPRPPVSDFAAWVAEDLDPAATVIDVGCGAGRDVTWMARRGHRAVGLDYVPRAFRREARMVARDGLPGTFDHVNLSELRSVLAAGATYVREPGPRVVTARHVLDATDAAGRRHLLLLARMLTSGGGRLVVETREEPGRPTTEQLLADIEASGGRVVLHEQLAGPSTGAPDPSGTATGPFHRMVIAWQR